VNNNDEKRDEGMGGKSIGAGGVRLAVVAAGHGVSHPMRVLCSRTCTRCACIRL